jgi:hypothetical protein
MGRSNITQEEHKRIDMERNRGKGRGENNKRRWWKEGMKENEERACGEN